MPVLYSTLAEIFKGRQHNLLIKGADMSDRFTTHGASSWCELLTTDVEGAKQFYGELLDGPWRTWPPEGGMQYTVIMAGKEEVGGIMDMPPHWGTYVTVNNLDAVAQKATELGGAVLVPPTDIPGVGRFSVLQDPQGAFFNVSSRTKQDHSRYSLGAS